MGWDGTPDNNRTKQQFIMDEFSYLNVIEQNWKGNNWFAAVSTKEAPERVIALTVMVRKEDGYWWKKCMDETCGPYVDGASRKVMQALTPLETLYPDGGNSYDWAKAWRERQENRTVPAKVNLGDWIKFQKEIRFTNGTSCDTFKKIGTNLWETEHGRVVKFQAGRIGVEFDKL